MWEFSATAVGDQCRRQLPVRRPSRSLVRRLTLLTILPATATALLLAVLLTRDHIREVEALALANAEATAAQLAAFTSAPLSVNDRANLRQLAASIVRRDDMVQVRVLSEDGQIITSADGPARDDAAGRVQVQRGVWSGDAEPVRLGEVSVELSLVHVERAQRKRLLGSALLLLVALVASYLFAWRSARRLAAPISELADAMDELGRGRRRVQVAVARDGEIGRLQRGFNAASETLADARATLESRIEGATRELAEKNDRLEASSLARTRFLAAASHDLRQPLYALTLLSSSLRAGETDPARLARAEHIEECVSSLDALFSELLDLSRLEAGAMQPDPVPFALDSLFVDVSRTFRMVAQKAELRFIARKTDLWVRADRVMLARVLNNLVSNAIRYTAAGGVLLGARRCREGVRIDVWDTGSGIAADEQARVFDEFFQAESSNRCRGERGLGLGLATVRRLAQLMGTRVVLQSRPGRGTLVSLTLTQATPVAGDAHSTPVDVPLDVSGLRMLVIDDEKSILEGTRVLVTGWGCEIRTAEDLEQALDIVEDWGCPDIVVSDLRLREGRNGLDALRSLASRLGAARLDDAPFAKLLITGETKSDRLTEIANSNVPVLHKPVPPERLREAVIAAVLAARAGV